jgi:hypothetical protein
MRFGSTWSEVERILPRPVHLVGWFAPSPSPFSMFVLPIEATKPSTSSSPLQATDDGMVDWRLLDDVGVFLPLLLEELRAGELIVDG